MISVMSVISHCVRETKTLHFAMFSFPDIVCEEREMHLKL